MKSTCSITAHPTLANDHDLWSLASKITKGNMYATFDINTQNNLICIVFTRWVCYAHTHMDWRTDTQFFIRLTFPQGKEDTWGEGMPNPEILSKDLTWMLIHILTIVTLPLPTSWVTSWNKLSRLALLVSTVPRFRITATVCRTCSLT